MNNKNNINNVVNQDSTKICENTFTEDKIISPNVKNTDLNLDITLNNITPLINTMSKTTDNNSNIVNKTETDQRLNQNIFKNTPQNNEILNMKSPPPSPIGTLPKSLSSTVIPARTAHDKSPSTSSIITQPLNNISTLNTLQLNHDIEPTAIINSNNNNSNKNVIPNNTSINNQVKEDITNKPPLFSNFNQKPKLTQQNSLPTDMNKITLNKKIPQNVDNKLNNASTSLRNDASKKDSTDKYNRSLNKHVPPKIHGIVLGQSSDDASSGASTLPSIPEKKGPKVITHKIFVEGRSDGPLPGSMSQILNNKEILFKRPEAFRVQKPIAKSQTSSKLELKENTVSQDGNKNLNQPGFSSFFDHDRFDRRGSDISCFLHNSENAERVNLTEEIKKLSHRLFQRGNKNQNATPEQEEEEVNDFMASRIPMSSFRNDPIGRFLANHGVVTRRPKFRMSYLNRDVPIGSPPPPSNLFYHLSHSDSDTWSDNKTHSAPQSPSISPEREHPTSLTKEVIMRLFDKPFNSSPTPFRRFDDASKEISAISSIDSLASYFKANNESKKNIPPFVTSK